MEVLLKFSLISPENRKLLTKEINFLLPLNVDLAKKCHTKRYTNEEALEFDRGVFKTPHQILNPSPEEVIKGDNDKTGDYMTLDYDLMLLCSLNYFKPKTKEQIKKNNEDIGYTFYTDDYFVSFIKNCKTKQGIKYFSKLILLKCAENKTIFDSTVSNLINILDTINDVEPNFFDESDIESEAEIYKNTGQYLKEPSMKTIKKNVSFIFRKLVLESKNDKFGEHRIKTCFAKLFSFFNKNKKYYSRAIIVVNIILNIFESTDIDSKKYFKELNEMLNWLTKYKIPPKRYEIKGITMYKDLPPIYHRKEMDQNQKNEFDRKETEKTNKKIERIKNIINNKKKEYNIANFDGDLSDFKFTFGDTVLYQDKEYVVINCLDEMIRVKLVNKEKKEADDIYENKKIKNKKKMNISEREKNKFWIETDNYQLRIKNLVNNN